MSEAALVFWNSMDSTPADKVLKRTQLDLQKRFPDIPCVSPMLAAPHFPPKKRLSNSTGGLDEVGKTLVDW